MLTIVNQTLDKCCMGFHKDQFWALFYFFFFINDLPLYVNNIKTDLYANDTTLYDIQNSVEDIENILQIGLDSLNTWCKCNGMLLNSSTKIMLVRTNQKRQRLDKEILDLKLNEESLSMNSNDKI